MIDSFNRTIDYLRVSVTDRCNLRCAYCMPPAGVTPLSHGDILSFEEILRLARVLAGLGIRRIKVTGGEPLVRKGTVDLIRKLKKTEGIEKVTLTSNGVLLGACLDELIDAGLDGVNISLDSLNRETFIRLTRGSDGDFERVQALLDRVKNLSPRGIKINCVPIRGVNEAGLVNLAAVAKDSDIAVRFIELMPLGCAAALEFIPGAEVAAALENAFGRLRPFTAKLGGGPAVYYSLEGFRGKIGFINPLSRNFCETCSRLRLGSTGTLRPCLACEDGLDLRTMLRGGAGDGVIAQAIRELVSQKPARHNFGAEKGRNASSRAAESDRKKRGMFRIGG
ncbi:MAG: GTP 3',8-cyclase MoaA [Treponema sp.]|jgi:cyclic pyranopterin phosphate synthase|nr:GTP 3',8-cyclase MoaA [Treponema sp.]